MCDKVHQLLAVGRWFPPGTPVSSTRKLISSSSFHRLDMTLAVAEALDPNKPKYDRIALTSTRLFPSDERYIDQVQQPVRSEWHVQDGVRLLSENVPFWSVIAHIFDTSGWNNITFGSQGNIGIIHSLLDFDLGMPPCDLELFYFHVNITISWIHSPNIMKEDI